MNILSTHTLTELEVSDAVYDEIAGKLKEAGYNHAFVDNTIDMSGIGLVRPAPPTDVRQFPVLNAPRGCATSVPWSALNEDYARINHDQTLEELARRGGMDPVEIFCNVRSLEWGRDGCIVTLQDGIDVVNELANNKEADMKKRQNPQQAVNHWNATVQIGDPVEYRSRPDAQPVRAKTLTAAQVLGGHTAVVWLDQVRGCVALAACQPVKADPAQKD